MENGRCEYDNYHVAVSMHYCYTIRLAYPVWMLENIISTHAGSGSKLFVMYDIACSLSKHLKVCSL